MVLQYQQRVKEAGSNTDAIEMAKYGLADYCRQGIAELMEKSHQDLLLLGKNPENHNKRFEDFTVQGPYHMQNGILYVGNFDHFKFLPDRWFRKEIQLQEIPLSNYKAEDLVTVATEIEKALILVNYAC